MDGMTSLRISPDERRTRLVELVSVLGGCDPYFARGVLSDGDRNVDLTAEPEAFGGCDDPWSDVALALIALRQPLYRSLLTRASGGRPPPR